MGNIITGLKTNNRNSATTVRSTAPNKENNTVIQLGSAANKPTTTFAMFPLALQNTQNNNQEITSKSDETVAEKAAKSITHALPLGSEKLSLEQANVLTEALSSDLALTNLRTVTRLNNNKSGLGNNFSEYFNLTVTGDKKSERAIKLYFAKVLEQLDKATISDLGNKTQRKLTEQEKIAAINVKLNEIKAPIIAEAEKQETEKALNHLTVKSKLLDATMAQSKAEGEARDAKTAQARAESERDTAAEDKLNAECLRYAAEFDTKIAKGEARDAKVAQTKAEGERDTAKTAASNALKAQIKAEGERDTAEQDKLMAECERDAANFSQTQTAGELNTAKTEIIKLKKELDTALPKNAAPPELPED